MKGFKRTFCLLLACSILLLTACSGKSNENTQTPQSSGRYVEKDITPPIEGQFASFLTAEEAIVCYSAGLKSRYESVDGGQTWKETPGPGAQSERYRDVSAGTLLNDGRLLVYVPEEGLLMIGADGGSQPYPVAEIDGAIAKGDTVMISLLQAVSENRLLLSYTIGGIMQVTRPEPAGGDRREGEETNSESDPAAQNGGPVTSGQPQEPAGGKPGTNEGPKGGGTSRSFASGEMTNKTTLYDITMGKPIAELPAEGVLAVDADNTKLYLLDRNGSVKAYNLEDGKPANSADIRFWDNSDSNGFMMAMPGMSNKTLAIGKGGLYAAHNGNLLLVPDGGIKETVLESTMYSTGAPRSSISSLYALMDGSILINLRTGEANRLYKYVWDENATLDPNKTLTIWSFEDNAFVRASIAELRKKHPDASITYEVALADGNAELAADAIKTLNTQLLNGSGPDVIILDGCPVDSYVNKGMLLELGSMIDTSDVYKNLLSPYSSDGKLYCMPMQFKMPLLMGSADALSKASTLTSLVGLVTAGNDIPAAQAPGTGFSGIPEEQRSELYFSDLRELCEVLWLASAPSIVSENKLNTDALGDYLKSAKEISDKYNLANPEQGGRMRMSVAFSDGGSVTELPGSLIRYTSQQTNYAAFTAGNLQLLQLVMERADSNITLFPGLATGAWEPSTTAGISADTKSAEFAAEFVKAMLSIEVQQLNYGTGLPVTRQGIAAQVDAINERLTGEDRGAFTIDVGALIEKLQVPSMGDTVLADMIWPSVEKCCKGNLSVEDAVKEIEQNVKNYLAERE